MNEHPSEEYIKGISGVKIIINEDLSDDEIMVSPRVYDAIKKGTWNGPVGYSHKQDDDFQKMLDELGDIEPTFDLTPPSFRCIPTPIYLNTPKPSREEIFKKAIEPILKKRGEL